MLNTPKITDYALLKTYQVSIEEESLDRLEKLSTLTYTYIDGKWYLSYPHDNTYTPRIVAVGTVKRAINTRMDDCDNIKQNYVVIVMLNAYNAWFYIFGNNGKRVKLMKNL